jgi:hypothetical protein
VTLVLDFSVQPYSIGDTILALAGAMADSPDGFDVVAVANQSVPHADPNMAERHSRPWESLGALLPLLDLAPVRSFTVTTKATGERGSYLTYDAIRRIAAYHARHGSTPQLRFSRELCEWADGFLGQFGRVVTVNMRRNPRDNPHRNCNPDVWAAALERCADELGVWFVVVGAPGEVDRADFGLSVTFAKDHGTTLLQDLALIHRSKAHIGSTSGPMAVAMLGTAPYCFVGADMKPHLARYGGALREDEAGDLVFSFASPGQRFSTQPESVVLLVDAIGRLLS